MKTIEEVKAIWKKTMIEVTNKVFDDVVKTAADEAKKDQLNTSNIVACMSMVSDQMEIMLAKNGITDEEIPIVKEHQSTWTKENMPWLMELICDRLHIKETLIKQGGKHE